MEQSFCLQRTDKLNCLCHGAELAGIQTTFTINLQNSFNHENC